MLKLKLHIDDREWHIHWSLPLLLDPEDLYLLVCRIALHECRACRLVRYMLPLDALDVRFILHDRD